MGDDKILKNVVKGLGQIGVETVEKAAEEGQKIAESIITGKELLGLERTMNDGELAYKKQQEKFKSEEEIKKIRNEMGGQEKKEEKPKERQRNIEDELTQLRRQKEREEEEKQKYFEEQKKRKEIEEQQQANEYNFLNEESSNPAKRKQSRGSAFINKKQKHRPDPSQMSATQEFNKGGKID